PKLISRFQLAKMKPLAVLVDVAIDQGGCFETSRPTTHHDPTYLVDGIIHYCVANMPGAVPHTSSHALSHATLPFGLALASKRMDAFKDPHLRAGLNIHAGKVMHQAVATSLGLPFAGALTPSAGASRRRARDRETSAHMCSQHVAERHRLARRAYGAPPPLAQDAVLRARTAGGRRAARSAWSALCPPVDTHGT